MTLSRAVPARRGRRHRPWVLPVLVVASLVPVAALAGASGLQGGPLPAAAGMTGLAGAVLLWWQFVLGVAPVSRLLTPHRGTAVVAHALLGSLGAFAALAHPLLEMHAERRGPGWLLAITPTSAEGGDVSWGRVALLLLVLVFVTSTFARAALGRRWWARVHLLTYPLAVLVFLHANAIGTFLLGVPWLRGYWSLLASTFLLVVLVRIAEPWWASAYRIGRSDPEGATATRLRLDPVGRARPVAAGDTVVLRRAPWTPGHPFSVVDVTPDGGVDVVAGVAGPFTRFLRSAPTGTTVRLGGPHGGAAAGPGPVAGDGSGPLVLLAGGVGVTAFARLAVDRDDAVLVHVTRGAPVLGAELAAACGPRYVPVTRSDPPPPGVAPGRFRVRDVVAGPDTRYLVCGSPGFVDGVTAELRACGVRRRQVHAEAQDT